jgi:hypothetical protein
MLTWIYTVLGLAGVWVMIRNGESLGAARVAGSSETCFLAAQEQPEGRYTVEFFPFVIATGGLALAAVNRRRPASRSARAFHSA